MVKSYMNLFLIGIIIFVIVYLLLNAFARASSKKIALTLKKIAVYLSLILAAIFTIGGKFLFSLPFLFVILSGLKIKGFTALQMFQLWRLIQFLKNSGRFSQGQFNQPQGSSSVSVDEAYKYLTKKIRLFLMLFLKLTIQLIASQNTLSMALELFFILA